MNLELTDRETSVVLAALHTAARIYEADRTAPAAADADAAEARALFSRLFDAVIRGAY